MTARVLLVGEAPSRAGARPLHPDDCASGRRLLEYTGWTRDEYLDMTDRCNLFDVPTEKWDVQSARGRLLRMQVRNGEDFVVLLGRKVARTIFGKLDFFLWVQMPWPGIVVSGQEYRKIAVVPHPSGLNRWWNDADNRRAARRFFNRLATEVWVP